MIGSIFAPAWTTAYIAKGQLAESNVQQVAKIRRILEDLSLEIATPAVARERLGLKRGDWVGI